MATERFDGSTRLVIVLALSIVTALAIGATASGEWQAPAAPQAQTGTGLIIGQVRDAGTNKGVAGAIVTLAGGPSPATLLQQRVMTDDDGGYVFSGVAKGAYNLTTTAPGYVDGVYGMKKPAGKTVTLNLADGEGVLDASIALWRFGAIAGTVLDDANEPIVGVSVTVMRRSVLWGEVKFGAVGSATTDDRGVYRFASLVPDDYIVAVQSSTTTLPSSVMTTFRAGPQNRELQQAIVAVTNSLSAPGQPSNRRVGDLEVQESNLGLAGPKLENAVFPTTFYPEAPSSARATVIAVGSGETRSSIDLHLRPVATRRVSGTLMGPSGPMPMVAMKLVSPSASTLVTESETSSTLTDGGGKFTFLGVPQGDYTLRAIKAPDPVGAKPGDETLWAAQPISVAEKDLALTVDLRPGIRVSGRFVFDGSKDKPARLSVLMDPVGYIPTSAHPMVMAGDADPVKGFTTFGQSAGRFVLHVSPVNGWAVRSAMLDGKDIMDVAVDLTSDVNDVIVTFTDRTTQVGGTVTTGQDSTRAPGHDATVVVFPIDSKMWTGTPRLPRRLLDVRASATGAYSFTTLPAGDYFIAAVDDTSLPVLWRDPVVLEKLSHVATRMTIEEGRSATQDLRTVVIK